MTKLNRVLFGSLEMTLENTIQTSKIKHLKINKKLLQKHHSSTTYPTYLNHPFNTKKILLYYKTNNRFSQE